MKYYKCHIAPSDVDQGGAPLLQGKGVFTKIFSEDSLKKKKFLLGILLNFQMEQLPKFCQEKITFHDLQLLILTKLS